MRRKRKCQKADHSAAGYLCSGIDTGLCYFVHQIVQTGFRSHGVAGFFSKSQKHGLQKAYLAAILARGAFHSLGGYLYWMDYMPENFPKALYALYPIIYNYSYILLEGVLTLVIISIPSVTKNLNYIKKVQ